MTGSADPPAYPASRSGGDAIQAAPDLVELLRFLDIDAAAMASAVLLWPLVAEHTDQIIEDFYAAVQRVEIGLNIDSAAIRRLKLRQKEHWRSLFGSRFDQQYVNSASLIGIKHREIGLDSKWYIAGYAAIKVKFLRIILESSLSPILKADMVIALNKYVAIDMALALSSYTSWLVD